MKIYPFFLRVGKLLVRGCLEIFHFYYSWRLLIPIPEIFETNASPPTPLLIRVWGARIQQLFGEMLLQAQLVTNGNNKVFMRFSGTKAIFL
uniref:Uncharacterized protein n=1 Tax=Tolypothrix bouteillei VB521301 TaxID=1479485 RepID=A0A0C1QZP2_9CYAN